MDDCYQGLKEGQEQIRNMVLNAMYGKLLADDEEREHLAQMAATDF